MGRILFINVPYAGHVNPTLGILEQLVKNGHEVGYINSPEFKEKIESKGAKFIPYINYPEKLNTIQKDHRIQMAAYTTGLRESSSYDLIIYEMMFYLGNTLAKQVNKPAIRIFTMFAYNDTVLKSMFFHSSSWFYFRFSNIRKIYTNMVAKNIILQEKDVFYEISRNIPELNIVCTTGEFQIYSEEFDNRYKFVGPIINQTISNNMTLDYKKFKNPIIYISMGTILKKKKLIKKCIKAFEKEKVDVIISVGRSCSVQAFGNVSENIHLFKFVNQLEVLKSADVFITHGGMNSINESMYYEVPMVVIPMCTDAYANAKRIQQLGLGIKISKFRISSRKLRNETFKVLNDNNIKSNIKLMKQKIDLAGGIDKVISTIESYIYKVKDKVFVR